MADAPQVGADPTPRSGESPASDVAARVRAFVHGGASQHNSRPAGEYIRSEAGGYEMRKHAAHTVAKHLRAGAHKRGLIGGTLSMVAAAYISRYQENMAAHQKMFEHTARAKRGDFEGMTTVDIRELHENAHKYGSPHVEAIQAAAKGELQRREHVRQREKREIRHKNMAEDFHIRAQQNEGLHERRMRQRDELHNQQMTHQEKLKTPRVVPPPSAAHPLASGLMTNAQHNEHRVGLSRLQRMAQAHQAAQPAGAAKLVYKGKLSLTQAAPGTHPPRTVQATSPTGQKANMVQIRGKKGGMIEKNTATGKLHYLGRKAAAQKRVRTNIDAAKARLRSGGR